MKPFLASHVGVVAELGYLIIAPLVLLSFYPSLYVLRFPVMLLSIAYMYQLSRALHLNKVNFGLRAINSGWKSSFFMTISIVVLMAILHFVYPNAYKIAPLITKGEYFSQHGYVWYVVYYALLSAPLQEFIFRSFYISRLEKVIRYRKTIILLSAAVFSGIHLPFQSAFIVAGTFLLGCTFAWHFLTYRNFYAVSVMHAVVGLVFATYYFS